MQYKLNIHSEAERVMNEHLEASFPYEGCGFFFGKNGKTREITEAQVVHNSKDGDRHRRFEISAVDYMKAERYALANDLDLLGVFHSHPNHPALPSVHDLRQAVPFFSYIIKSIYEGELCDTTSWRLNEETNEFEEESVEIELIKNECVTNQWYYKRYGSTDTVSAYKRCRCYAP